MWEQRRRPLVTQGPQLRYPDADQDSTDIDRLASVEAVFRDLRSFGVQRRAQFGPLMRMMNRLDRLLEANREQDADNYDREVNRDVAPGVDGLVRCVDVDH
jgi:hypothetical protein